MVKKKDLEGDLAQTQAIVAALRAERKELFADIRNQSKRIDELERVSPQENPLEVLRDRIDIMVDAEQNAGRKWSLQIIRRGLASLGKE